MNDQQLRPAILVISETAHKDPSSDKSSAILKEVFQSNSEQWRDPESKIIPDDFADIQRAVTQWTDSQDAVNLIVTTGGTGFALKDNTPEAIHPLLHKHAPGLVHGMLAASLAVTPFAVMSRPLAGVRHGTIIVTLPGSPKGARENLESVIKLLPHACQQAAGANSRELHAGGVQRLERQAGVQANGKPPADGPSSHDHHQHHHKHDHSHGPGQGGHKVPVPHTSSESHPQSNDPLEGPTRRQRSSPYPMLSVEEALNRIGENVPKPHVIRKQVNQDLVGYVLADDVTAIEGVPAFRASIVDGYAIIAPNSKGIFPVAFASHAQAGNTPTLQKGQIARITTGAPLPPGSTAVVMVEDTVLVKRTADGQEEAEVEILTDEVEEGENVREIGSDVKAGSVIMRKGEGVTAFGGELGLLASVGVKEVSVFSKPVVGVLSTGDEIVPHDRPGGLELGEVRDTNRPTLLTVATNAGFKVVDFGIASDKSNALEANLRKAFAEVDVLITSGGVSMGELDLLKPTIERSLGGTIHMGRVSMKPGKPTTFATIPTANFNDPSSEDKGIEGKRIIFSLPGNPASAVVTFMLFVLPALHMMSGVKPVGLSRVGVRLETDVMCDKVREEYHRVVVFTKGGREGESGSSEAGLWASSTGGQRSSRIGSFKGANALLKLPAGGGKLRRGQWAEALMMGPIAVGI